MYNAGDRGMATLSYVIRFIKYRAKDPCLSDVVRGPPAAAVAVAVAVAAAAGVARASVSAGIAGAVVK